MTTVMIDDDLAMRLRTLRGDRGDFNRLVTEALSETIRRWEWEEAGRTEMKAMLAGPRHTLAEADERMRGKLGHPNLSHLTASELADRAEAALADLPPENVAEAKRLGLI